MTKDEILKLAGFDYSNSRIAFQHHKWPTNETISQHTYWTQGQESENTRLLPLIEALADSNEKLVEALELALEPTPRHPTMQSMESALETKLSEIRYAFKLALAEHKERILNLKEKI